MVDDSSIARVTGELRELAAGRRPGDALPGSRAIAARLGVGPVTVSRAVARLVAEGVLVTESGRGTFVATPRRAAAGGEPDFGWQTVALADRMVDSGEMARHLAEPESGVVDLACGYLDPALQPVRALADALARAGRRPGAWDRPPVCGLRSLRTAFGELIGTEPADVLVVPGGQGGLSAALRALAPPGAPVLTESPTYVGMMSLARASGMRPVAVAGDEHGMRPDLLAETLALTGARVVYSQPSFANPTGTLMPAARRAEILQVVRDAAAFLIEDDTARLLALDAEVPPSLYSADPDGHVVQLLSLTKVAAPSLRIGALAARGPAAARLRALRLIDDFFVPQPMQEAAVELLGSAAWGRHRTALRRELIVRRDAMLAALAAYAPDIRVPAPPRGGLHLWCELPDGLDDRDVDRQAAQRGLRVTAGAPYHAAEPNGPTLRLTYCHEPPDRLAHGVKLLGDAVRAELRRNGRMTA